MENEYSRRKTIASNVKAHKELDRISRFWEKCKSQRGKALDRELHQLSERLGQLTKEQQVSKHEFEELKILLNDLEEAENEMVPGAWILGNLVERHFYIEECRRKIEKLLKRSHLQRHSDPSDLLGSSKPSTDRAALSVHDVALGLVQRENRYSRGNKSKDGPPSDSFSQKSHSQINKQDGAAGPSCSNFSTSHQGHKKPPDIPDTTPTFKSFHHAPSVPRHVEFKEATKPSMSKLFTDGTRPQLRRGSMVDGLVGGKDGASDIKEWQPLRKTGVASSPHFAPAKPAHGVTREKLLSHSDFVRGKAASRRKPSLAVHSEALPEVPELDFETIQKCYDYMSQAPSVLGIDQSVGRHTNERNERRRVLAIENVLEKVYHYRINKTMMTPMDALNCRYLRLTPHNIEELERQCRRRGIDPGLHAFSTEEQILDYFERKNQTGEEPA